MSHCTEGVERHTVPLHHTQNSLMPEDEVRIHHRIASVEAEWDMLAAELGTAHPVLGMNLGNIF